MGVGHRPPRQVYPTPPARQSGGLFRFSGESLVTQVIMVTDHWEIEVVGEDALDPREVTVPTRGVVYVHSSPLAVCQHVEWAIARVVGTPVRLDWTAQPMEPSSRRAESSWGGAPGTGAELAAALRQWPMTRFEVTEDPSQGVDGERFMHVPGRGLFRATMSANGDIVISEDRLRTLMASARGPEGLAHALDLELGTAWDAELEPYRHAGDGAPVSYLTRVG